MSEQTEQPQPEQQQLLPSLLKKLPNAPTQEQIDKWKDEHGEVFVFGFSETEL